MPMLLQTATRVALDLIYPQRCLACGGWGAALCARCGRWLPRAAAPRCARCWEPGPSPCRECARRAPAFAAARAACVMDGEARRVVHALKYEGLTALAPAMAALLPDEAADGCDLVVPVPLHGGRERARGFNQAALLARAFAAAHGLPYDARAARRVRNTPQLAHGMGRAERRAVMAGAFAAQRARVDGRRVLLMDDVMTTGATLDACARALREAGAREVRALVFARAGEEGR